MSGRERLQAALAHGEPDRVPLDFGGCAQTTVHVGVIAELREHFGLERRPVKVEEPYTMMGRLDEDLKAALEVEALLEGFIASGFDIINPVQWTAANMEMEMLKERFGERIVFWGGGVDTQKTLPFGRPQEVREQVLRACEIFAPGGGFVFNTIHNIQARTPLENVAAMLEALRQFNGQDK